jgi:hypothetical protein
LKNKRYFEIIISRNEDQNVMAMKMLSLAVSLPVIYDQPLELQKCLFL